MENEKMNNIEQSIEKAETLIEALPYIQQFANKIVVVKYGGSAMLNEDLQEKVIKDIALLKLVGMKPVIVHGGGKEISKWIDKAGLETKFVNGLRVTDEATMEIAEMVLNKVNKNLVAKVEMLGVKATLDGLQITPNVPDNWENYEVNRIFRGVKYSVKFIKSEEKKILVNGKAHNSNILNASETDDVKVEVYF